MKDKFGLYDNVAVQVDPKETGINANVAVVGATNSGKTMSHTESRLVNTRDSSLVVTVSKKAFIEKYSSEFSKHRGYKVKIIDTADPANSDFGYDPLISLGSADLNILCDSITETVSSKNDKFWEQAAGSLLKAFCYLELENAKVDVREPEFVNVVKMLNKLTVTPGIADMTETNFDEVFKRFEKIPDSKVTQHWKAFSNLACRTSSCVLGELNCGLNKVFTTNTISIMKKKRKIDFRELGQEKTLLFIVTSPVDEAGQEFVNIMYADMIKKLFDLSEKIKKSLDVPVHIICDDFACTGKIKGFERYISIFRAAGISVSILLQSESQLSGMYGKNGATTIINNCDTYIYFGGMDVETCNSVAIRANKPVNQVMSMPLEQVWVFRRGSMPVEGRRYQILEDPEYKLVEKNYRKEIENNRI